MTAAQNCSDLRRWNALAVRTFGEIEVQARPGGFHGALEVRDWPALRVAHVASTPARVCGGPARRPGWFLLYNRGGTCSVRQSGRQALLADGEMSVVRADDPYELQFAQPNRMSVVGLPLLDAPAVLAGRVALRHGADDAAPLGTLLQRLEGLSPDAASRLDAGALRRVFADLLVLAVPVGEPAPAAAGRREALVMRLQALVEHRLDDPELDAAALGQALGVSARYVQMLLAGQGITLGAYLVAQRLQRAAALLRERPDRIADIALQVGFGDVSHFCRCFRQRYGCTARQWRSGR